MSGLNQAAAVVGAVALAVVVDYACTRVQLWLDSRQAWPKLRAAYDAGAHVDLIEVDHMGCANRDCGQTICCCRKPAECNGTTTLGCPDENLCWDCRLGCSDCAWEHHTEQAMDWAAGR